MADPTCRGGMASVVDCRKVTALPSSQELRAMAANILDLMANSIGGRCAVLVASDVAFGLVRMYDAYSDGAPVEVGAFRAPDEAMAWLKGNA